MKCLLLNQVSIHFDLDANLPNGVVCPFYPQTTRMLTQETQSKSWAREKNTSHQPKSLKITSQIFINFVE